MYSQPGRPGPGRGGKGRYMKGRLPQGVDFAAYPGRSSTPLPTAESKSAERINQLKIWNEAATNDDKRRLHTAKSKQALSNAGAANRRTDSFKDARERHSASFQSDATKEKSTPPTEEKDIFADRSDSDSDPNVADKEDTIATSNVSEDMGDDDLVEADVDEIAPAKLVEPHPVSSPPQKKVASHSVPSSTPVNQTSGNHSSGRQYVPSSVPAPSQSAPPTRPHESPVLVPAKMPKLDPVNDGERPERQQRKESSGCCVIQ